MSYQAITFTYGEQPTAAKWNLLGTNDATFNQQFNNGWVEPNETWIYASATTITVPSGAVSKYAVGDKIKLTQTTVKYFYITAVADELLTITGGTDYTLANAVISSPYYSKVVSPAGFPDVFSCALSPAGFSAFTEDIGLFVINGKRCKLWVNINGTSNSATTTASAPVTAKNGSVTYHKAGSHPCVDNGADYMTGYAYITKNTATITMARAAGTNYTNSGQKAMWFALEYEI